MCDEQFLIQPDGNVQAIDFDHYTFVDSRNRRWAYEGITDHPDVDYWKTAIRRTIERRRPVIEKLRALYAGGD